MLSLCDYVLIYPAIVESGSDIFNIGILILGLLILTFLSLGAVYIYNAEN
jgi:hypothetical protein